MSETLDIVRGLLDMVGCAKLSRLEVIDRTEGRLLVLNPVDVEQFSYQDEGRTLKIFVNVPKPQQREP